MYISAVLYFFEDFYKNSVIYIKDSGKHWKNDFFCDRIVLKSVYEKAAEMNSNTFLSVMGNEKGKR